MKSKRLLKKKKSHSKKIYYGGALKIGSSVRIQNIIENPKLNGIEGICIDLNKDGDKWYVFSKGGELIGEFMPENLLEIEAEAQVKSVELKDFNMYLNKVRGLLDIFSEKQKAFDKGKINEDALVAEYEQIIVFLESLDTNLSHYSISPPNENIQNIFDASIDINKGIPFLFLFLGSIINSTFNRSPEVVEKVKIIIELLYSKGANINISIPETNENIILKEIKTCRESFIPFLLRDGADPNQYGILLYYYEPMSKTLTVPEIPIFQTMFMLFTPKFIPNEKSITTEQKEITKRTHNTSPIVENIFFMLIRDPRTKKNIMYAEPGIGVDLHSVECFFRQQIAVFANKDVVKLFNDANKNKDALKALNDFKDINPAVTTGYPKILIALLENNYYPKLIKIFQEIKKVFDKTNLEYYGIKVENPKANQILKEIYATQYASIIDNKLPELERKKQEFVSNRPLLTAVNVTDSVQPPPVAPLSEEELKQLQGSVVTNEILPKKPASKKKGKNKNPDPKKAASEPGSKLDSSFDPFAPAFTRTADEEAEEISEREAEKKASAAHAVWLREQQQIENINDVYLNKLGKAANERVEAPAYNLDENIAAELALQQPDQEAKAERQEPEQGVAVLQPENQGIKSELKLTAAEFRPRQNLRIDYDSDIQNPLAIEFKQLVSRFIQKSRITDKFNLALVNEIYSEVEKEIKKFIPHYSISGNFGWAGNYKLELALIILIIGFLSCQFTKSRKCDILLKGGKSLQMMMEIDSTDIDILLIPVYGSNIKITNLQYYEYATYINRFILWINDSEYVFPWTSEYKKLGIPNPQPEENIDSSSIVKISTQLVGIQKEMIDIGYGYNFLHPIAQRIMFTPWPLLIRNYCRPLNTELNYWYLTVFQIIQEKLFYHYYYTTYNSGQQNQHFLSKITKFLAYVYKNAPRDFLKSEILRIYNEIYEIYIEPLQEYLPVSPEKIQQLIDAVEHIDEVLNQNPRSGLKKGGYLKRWNTKKHKRYNKYKKVQRKSKKGRKKY
jgi:hypothetical protein